MQKKPFFFFRERFFAYVNKWIEEDEILLHKFETGEQHCYLPDKSCAQRARKRLEYWKSGVQNAENILTDLKDQFVSRILKDIESCLKDQKNHPKAHFKPNSQQLYDQGYAHFLLGDFFQSMQDIENYLSSNPENSELLQVLGETCSNLGLYQNAIDCLTKVIREDPKNLKAFIERAAAYFELGNYELALEDYISSGKKFNEMSFISSESLEFSAGLIKGTTTGALHSLENFVPSMLCSLQGLANGLWSFALDPSQVSKELVESCKNTIQFLRETPALDSLKLAVPEIRELIDNWSNITEFRKGELIGTTIGKYGIDIFLMAGAVKGVRVYQELRLANTTLTLDALNSVEKRRILQEISAQWKERIQNPLNDIKSARSISKDLAKKFKNQSLTEQEVRKILHNVGFPTYPKPKGLVLEDFEVKVSNTGGGMRYINKKNPNFEVRVMPGNPNSPHPVQKSPYVVHQTPKGRVDKKGKVAPKKSPESHIPLEEYDFEKMLEVYQNE